MGFTEILGIIAGIFKFFDQVTWLVKTLQGTPVEKQQEITKALQLEAENFRKTGRPTWD